MHDFMMQAALSRLATGPLKYLPYQATVLRGSLPRMSWAFYETPRYFDSNSSLFDPAKWYSTCIESSAEPCRQGFSIASTLNPGERRLFHPYG
jgi:hypothetical protein